jgi:hypothetical protein
VLRSLASTTVEKRQATGAPFLVVLHHCLIELVVVALEWPDHGKNFAGFEHLKNAKVEEVQSLLGVGCPTDVKNRIAARDTLQKDDLRGVATFHDESGSGARSVFTIMFSWNTLRFVHVNSFFGWCFSLTPPVVSFRPAGDGLPTCYSIIAAPRHVRSYKCAGKASRRLPARLIERMSWMAKRSQG